MIPERWLLRMAQWAHHPPPLWRVLLWAAVIALCLAVFGIEKAGYWPDWMTVNSRAKVRF
ncbi:MAG: hypothetical protein U1E48_01345 [Paracoccaceae bacterium]